MRCSAPLAVAIALLGSVASVAGEDKPLAGVRRVVFLGDSITYAGQYVEYVEAYLRVNDPGLRCEFLNLGLPSETVSGLSEPGHAGGNFPRPVLGERLDRVLEQAMPNLIVACYGMNDGIYHPFREDRFRAYQDGIRALRDRAAKAGAKVIHLTPPVFDSAPIRASTLPGGLDEYRRPFVDYDQVLERYAAWLVARKAEGWDVVDIHGPIKTYLAEERKRDPAFCLAADGVHIDATGHWLIARALLTHWGIPAADLARASTGEQALAARPHGPEVLKLVQRRQRLSKDAWLTATGHKRPGMGKGLPLAELDRQAAEIETKLRRLLEAKP